jgi:hypothetical protein
MKKADRAYRDIEMLLARAAGDTYEKIGKRFDLSERQARRVVEQLRDTRPGRDLEAAHLTATIRHGQLSDQTRLLSSTLGSLDGAARLAHHGLMLEYLKELRELEELMGLRPREIAWRFDQNAAAELWVRFKRAISKSPGADAGLYDALFREYEAWAEGQLKRLSRKA